MMIARKLKSARRLLAGAIAMLLLAGSAQNAAAARETKAESGFSFAAYGDSRPMMYLPPKGGQADLNRMFVEMFGLILPEKVAEDLVQKTVKLTYDPDTKELIQIVMPFASQAEVMTLSVNDGWVTQASVENLKLLPGLHRTMFQLIGGEWVTREIVKNVQSGRARFVVSSGDVVWWGNQGRTINDSPYWKRLNDTMLSQLPPPDSEMRAAGLDGRWFVGPGNHEAWGDPKMEGVINTLPYLKKLGVTPDNPTYKFDFKGARFIFLWSGKYDYRSGANWSSDQPTYAEQMKQLKQWMDEAKAKGIKKVFISFHYPVFARAGFGPLPPETNPHKLIASYAKDMEVVVFNGHVHTTEMFDVDGVKYLLLGGGGAEQDPILPGRTSAKVPADYPQDLYWKGEPPKEDYNYVLVDVNPGQKTKFTLTRLRTWSATPLETVELFK